MTEPDSYPPPRKDPERPGVPDDWGLSEEEDDD